MADRTADTAVPDLRVADIEEVDRTAVVVEEVTSINTIHHDSSIHTRGLEYSRPWFFPSLNSQD
jgi:hypothetical protein